MNLNPSRRLVISTSQKRKVPVRSEKESRFSDAEDALKPSESGSLPFRARVQTRAVWTREKLAGSSAVFA